MKWKQTIDRCRKVTSPFRITDGEGFRLKHHDPADTLWFKSGDKARAKVVLATGVEMLAALQDRLYAQDRWSILLIFQAMDAAGKDSAIKHVMSGVNPQGCQVASFKTPTSEELDHDFLWRCVRHLPERGRIGIFNRSYYEEVLIVRVHPEYLDGQMLPRERVTRKIWDERFDDIRNFEEHLGRSGICILKFFLNVSKKEQKRRFLERLENPEKHWKFCETDIRERSFWDEYMEAYEDAIRETATKDAPWYVVPADNKWFTRIVVAAAVIEAMARLDLHYPEVGKEKLRELMALRKALGGVEKSAAVRAR